MPVTTFVTTFVFNSGSTDTPAKAIRVVTLKDDPWFVAADVLECLGLTLNYGAGHQLRHLNASEKLVLDRKDATPEMWGLYGKQVPRLMLISESGLYKAIMRSDKPEAKQFQNWVTQQVLPSIRKTGAYVVGQAPIETRKDDPFAFVEGQMVPLEKILTTNL